MFGRSLIEVSQEFSARSMGGVTGLECQKGGLTEQGRGMDREVLNVDPRRDAIEKIKNHF